MIRNCRHNKMVSAILLLLVKSIGLLIIISFGCSGSGGNSKVALNTYYIDTDSDGYGDPKSSRQAESPPSGYVLDNTDCNDSDDNVHPSAIEICDGIDNDCDSETDEGVTTAFYRDKDGDGYGDVNDTIQACAPPTGYVTDNTDCNDDDASINPGAIEICGDDIDQNCKGGVYQLLRPVDLTYMGSFRLPIEYSVPQTFSYGGMAATYYPKGDPSGPDDGYPGSLFVSGHVYGNFISEIAIPEPLISDDYASLPVSYTLQPFGDISDGFRIIPGGGYTYLGGLVYVPAQAQQKTDLIYWNLFVDFPDETIMFQPSFGSSTLDLSQTEDAEGLWSLGDYPHTWTSNYMTTIPEGWADEYTPGKTILSGLCGYSIASTRSLGPSLYAFNPIDTDNPPLDDAKLDTIELLYYPFEDYPFQGIHAMENYNLSDQYEGAAFIRYQDKEGIIFYGTKTYGDYPWDCYGIGTTNPSLHKTINEETGVEWCYDPCGSDKGTHGYPYQAQILFFDPCVVGEVALGLRDSYDVVPYDVLYPFPDNDCGMIGDIAVDDQNGIIYVIDGWHEEPEVHVFKIEISDD